MYTPPEAKETRPEVLAAAMRAIKLAVFVSPGPETIHATHAPTVVREEAGSVVIETHFARANAHIPAEGEALRTIAIYQGPNAYITPSWYPTKQETGKVVPTWNYIAVHAEGTLSRLDDDALLRHLGELTDENERDRAAPWAVSDAPGDFIPRLARAIVGVRLTVTRLEGSWKMAQHKPEADRKGATRGLLDEQNPSARAVGEIMANLEAAR